MPKKYFFTLSFDFQRVEYRLDSPLLFLFFPLQNSGLMTRPRSNVMVERPWRTSSQAHMTGSCCPRLELKRVLMLIWTWAYLNRHLRVRKEIRTPSVCKSTMDHLRAPSWKEQRLILPLNWRAALIGSLLWLSIHRSGLLNLTPSLQIMRFGETKLLKYRQLKLDLIVARIVWETDDWVKLSVVHRSGVWSWPSDEHADYAQPEGVLSDIDF
jgi:hypothetical protein